MNVRRGLAQQRAALLMAPWVLVLAGCSRPQSGDASVAAGSPPAPPAASSSATPQQACQVEPVQYVVGSPYTAELGEKVREQSGATVVRVLHPDQVVTMEFRFDRVNITVDGAGAITQVNCG